MNLIDLYNFAPQKPRPRRVSPPAPRTPRPMWHQFFAQTFPPRIRTRLENLVQRALDLTESGEAWTESLSMREAITEYTGGITPEELIDDPAHAAVRRRVQHHFGSDDDDLFDIYRWRPHELLGISSARDVPGIDPSTALSEADLADIAEAIFTRAAEAESGWGEEGAIATEERLGGGAHTLLEEDLRHRAKLAPIRTPDGSPWPRLQAVGTDSRIHVIDKKTAYAFVNQNHKEMEKAEKRPGLLVAIGFTAGGKLRGVGLANTPSGRALKSEDQAQHHVIDVSRIATDDVDGRGSVHGASSAIMRWFMQHGQELVRPKASAPASIITYSFLTETAATYKSLFPEGLHAVALTEGKEPGGSRAGSEGGKKGEWKIRWEAGANARPHLPYLLELHRGYTAIAEGRPLKSEHFRGLTTTQALLDLGRVIEMPMRTMRTILKNATHGLPENNQTLSVNEASQRLYPAVTPEDTKPMRDRDDPRQDRERRLRRRIAKAMSWLHEHKLVRVAIDDTVFWPDVIEALQKDALKTYLLQTTSS